MKTKLTSGNQYLHAHMDGILLNAAGNTFWQDLNGKFLGANENELGFFGLSSFNDLMGRDQRELTDPTQAPIYIKNDQMVIHSGKGMVFIEPAPREKDKQQYISYKAPLYNSQAKIIGTFGIGYELGSLPQEQILKEIALFAGLQAQSIFKESLFDFHRRQLDLSTRQLVCLELLVKGLTYKQIGASLGLSHRTVEHYFEAIKIKLKCESRQALIATYVGAQRVAAL